MSRELTIVTPEHVHIRLEPAGVGSRFLATVVDSFIVHGAATLILVILALALPGRIAAAIFITVNFVLAWSWHVFFETRKQGRTPGKRALGIRVIDARGLPVSLYQSLVRNITRVLDFAPAFYGIAAISALASASHRRLGDVVADTLVIRDAQPLAWRGQLAAERRYNSLRTPRVLRLIRHRIGLEEREFLLTLCLRAEKMSPAARYDLMEEVAAFYRGKLDVEEEHMSGENFVRDLTAVVFHPREEEARRPLPHQTTVR
ncbi:MAG TPA: RDD family protein [Thermoanaerobaculia bacterium]|nr:RDD family protein [Thermoanaerobaculia bacterium]